MIEAYLEENPNDARIIVQKLFLQLKARHAAKKAREMVQQNRNGWRWIARKMIVQSKILQNAKYILSRRFGRGTAKQGRDRAFQANLPTW
jgi:DNA gyrase subunit B